MLILLLRLVNLLIDAYMALLIARMVLSWVNVLSPGFRPRGLAWSLIDVVYRLTDPPLRFLNRYIPPLRMGPVAFDMSFLVLYFLLIVLRVLI